MNRKKIATEHHEFSFVFKDTRQKNQLNYCKPAEVTALGGMV